MNVGRKKKKPSINQQIKDIWNQGKDINSLLGKLKVCEHDFLEIKPDCKCHKKFRCKCGDVVRLGGFTCEKNKIKPRKLINKINIYEAKFPPPLHN